MGDTSVYVCGICEEILKEPKDLPCTHSFCRACLQKHCLEKATENGFPCPTCEKKVVAKDPTSPIIEWAESIPTNMTTVSTLEKMYLTGNTGEQDRCVFCLKKWKTVTATKYCKACQEYFCDECGNQHWLLRASKEHRVMLIEDLIDMKNDPLLRARLVLIFNAKVREACASSKSRGRHQHEKSPRPKDENTSGISGATFLASGHLVLIDKANNKLKLFDKQYGFKSSVNVEFCHDVTAVTQYFIAVTCPQAHCLKMFSIYNNEIEEEATIQTDPESECFGLCRFQDDKFVVTQSGKPVSLMQYSGPKLINKIEIEGGKLVFTNPQYVAYSTEKEQFFMSDTRNKCLLCSSKTGTFVWETTVKGCQGLVIADNYLILARSDRHTVDIVGDGGRMLKSLVLADDGLSDVSVICADYWKQGGGVRGRRLAVSDNSDLVRVFMVEDPMNDADLKVYFKRQDTSYGEDWDSKFDKNPDAKKSHMCVII